jgi:hypothetical protein
MATKIPLIMRSAASPECSELIQEMMKAATSRRDTLDPEDLANAAFSIMCFGLAKMEDDSARDEFLRSLPEEVAKAIADIVRNSRCWEFAKRERTTNITRGRCQIRCGSRRLW